MMPDGMEMTVGFLIGLVTGSIVGVVVRHIVAVDELRVREPAAYLRGRNHERRAHGEDELEPPPELEDLWRFGIGAAIHPHHTGGPEA